ncbi:MAG: hypothetical protein Q8J80_09760 [Gallionella sp.]|nr:hypothetical protein [Gallionella sp.]
MKDPNDNATSELSASAVPVPQGRGQPSIETKAPVKMHWSSPKPQPKRGGYLARQVHEPMPEKVPAGAMEKNGRVSFVKSHVPVSFAARDWGVTSRRIRFLLAEGRLEGRREDNGYWVVTYPYRFQIGTRGPVLKRHQRSLKEPQKPELRLV